MVRGRAKIVIAFSMLLMFSSANAQNGLLDDDRNGKVPARVTGEVSDYGFAEDPGLKISAEPPAASQYPEPNDEGSSCSSSVKPDPHLLPAVTGPAAAVSASGTVSVHAHFDEMKSRSAERFLVSVSSGTFIPVLRYADRYSAAWSFGAEGTFPSCSVSGFYPALGLSYVAMKTKADPLYVASRMALYTGTFGARRAIRFECPSFIKDHTFLTRGWYLNTGAYGGMTSVSFTSEIRHSPLVDYVATAGVSCGAYLTLLEHLDAGVNLSAQRIFTAGVPLDSVGVTLCVAGSW